MIEDDTGEIVVLTKRALPEKGVGSRKKRWAEDKMTKKL